MREIVGVVVPILLLTVSAAWVIYPLFVLIYAIAVSDGDMALWALGHSCYGAVAFIAACVVSKWVLKVTEKPAQ